MALNLNGNSPKKILFNGLNVAKVLFNGVVVWIAKILQFLSGYPLTLENSTGENLVDYKIYGNQAPEAIILPEGYTQLEYIESTGTQYIDTLIKETKAYMFEFEFTPLQFNGGQRYGSYLSGTLDNFTIGDFNSLTVKYLRHRGTEVSKTINVSAVNKNTFSMMDNVVNVNGVTISRSTTNSLGTGSSNIFILTGSDKRRTTIAKIYSLKLYDGSKQLLRDLIPVRRNEDNEVGMYDKVTKQFFTNQGTGNFIAGREITTKVGKVGDEYYKAGEQLYKIPIKVSNDTETEYEIYLNKPLGKIEENADYIDFENKEVAYYDYLTDTYTKENIELPEIPTQKGTNIITVETSLQPSKMSVLYYKEST